MGRGRFQGGIGDQHNYHYGDRTFQNLYSAELVLGEKICKRDSHRWKKISHGKESCLKCPIMRTWNPERIKL